MKNRKRIITTLIGMALTSQLSPVTYTIVNAQEPTVVQAQDEQEQQKTGLAANVITLGGNGCWENENAGIHKVEIKFNTKDMKLVTKALSGYEGSEHSFHEYCPGEYIVVELISGTTGRIKKHVAMSGKDNIKKLTNALNDTPFEYGDSLRIYHGEGMQRTTITGPVLDKNKNNININKNYDTIGVSKEDLNNFQFVITKGGLKQVAQNIIEVDSTDELIKQLLHLSKCKHQATIKLTENITFDDDAIRKLSLLSNKKELIIPEGTTLTGINNNIEINLNGQASLVLKGDYTGLQNITIKNSDKDGVQVYDSDYSSLKKVSVVDSKGYGIYANGSTVAMQDCTTENNVLGGVLISSSIDLQLRKNKSNSTVTFKTNTNKFKEGNQVVIKNLELIRKSDSRNITKIQNNTFKVENNKMGTDKGSNKFNANQYSNTPALSQMSKDILKKYELSIDDVQIKEYYKIYKF